MEVKSGKFAKQVAAFVPNAIRLTGAGADWLKHCNGVRDERRYHAKVMERRNDLWEYFCFSLDEGSSKSSAMPDYEARFGAIGRLYGVDGLKRLSEAHVCVIGLGGVGSWAVEALARSGIGKLTLVDMDDVCLSNVNRQLHALDGTIGRSKAVLLAERVAKISPRCIVTVEECFLTESSMDRLLEPEFDYIIDAIDTTKYKCMLIAEARKRGLNLITCGGAGGRIDPSRVQIADLARSINDPLLLQVRKRLRQQYGFPMFKRQKFKIDCVFTDELPVFPTEDGFVSCQRQTGADYRLNCDQGFGSATYLTGTFGFFLAARVVAELTGAQ